MTVPQHRISAEAEAARERARDHGKFGTQNLDKSHVAVPRPDSGTLTHAEILDADAAESQRIMEELRADTTMWGSEIAEAAAAQFSDRRRLADSADADAHFPYGKLWSNVDRETGKPDYARRTPDGGARPCVSRNPLIEKPYVDRATDAIDEWRREHPDLELGPESFYQCREMVDASGGSFDATLPQSHEAMRRVRDAALTGDKEKLRGSLTDLMEQQQSNARVQRPIGVSWLPVDPVVRDGVRYGPAYDRMKGNDADQIADSVRNDLETAQMTGWIPDSVEYRVETEKYVDGQAINVGIKGADRDWSLRNRGEGWGWGLPHDEHIEITKRVQDIVQRYNYERHEPASLDYERNYDYSVSFERDYQANSYELGEYRNEY